MTLQSTGFRVLELSSVSPTAVPDLTVRSLIKLLLVSVGCLSAALKGRLLIPTTMQENAVIAPFNLGAWDIQGVGA